MQYFCTCDPSCHFEFTFPSIRSLNPHKSLRERSGEMGIFPDDARKEPEGITLFFPSFSGLIPFPEGQVPLRLDGSFLGSHPPPRLSACCHLRGSATRQGGYVFASHDTVACWTPLPISSAIFQCFSCHGGLLFFPVFSEYFRTNQKNNPRIR